MIPRFLSLIGLMRRSEHERIVSTKGERNKALNDEADLLSAKFKKAITDLEKQAAEIADWRTALERMEGDRDNWREQALRDAPDAEAMRTKRARDRDQKAARRKERGQP